jgi:hypothetical protein
MKIATGFIRKSNDVSARCLFNPTELNISAVNKETPSQEFITPRGCYFIANGFYSFAQ